MNKKELDNIYKESLEKPERFHHLCYAGGSTKIIDTWASNKKYICRYQGDKNWMTPSCEKCKGLISKIPTLTRNQRFINEGIKRLYDKIINHIK